MASSSKAASDLNPRTTHYEFMGPPGAFAITIGVPTMTYLLYYGCSEETGGCPPPIDFGVILDTVSNPEFWKGLWDTQAVLAYLGWYAFTVVAWLILPGDWIEGTEMRNGQKKQYKINGAQLAFSCMRTRLLTPLKRSRLCFLLSVSRLVLSTARVPSLSPSSTSTGLVSSPRLS